MDETKATMEVGGETVDLTDKDAARELLTRKLWGAGSVVGRETRELFVKLTESEVLQRGRELANAEVRARTHELNAKDIKAGLKSEEERITKEIDRLTSAVTLAREMREVEVELMRDDRDRRKLCVVRCDTGEIVERRIATDAELQGLLPGV